MNIREITQKLIEPFSHEEIKFKPTAVKGNRALAIAYVDARVVAQRLDDVLGIDGWEDRYQCLEDGSVVCTLRCRLSGEWVTKEDVGSESEQKDSGDKRKAAFSDALKRAAVKFGVGRYLYRFPNQWVEWDERQRCFAQDPKIPEFARKNDSSLKPTAKPANSNGQIKDLHDLHKYLVRNGKTWREHTLPFLGIKVPTQFMEPNESGEGLSQIEEIVPGVKIQSLIDQINNPPKKEPQRAQNQS